MSIVSEAVLKPKYNTSDLSSHACFDNKSHGGREQKIGYGAHRT
jgi:hypothetical protein